MRDYRLYFLSHDGRHIDRFEPVEADNDTDAIAAATAYRCYQPLELWWRGRMVCTVSAR